MFPFHKTFCKKKTKVGTAIVWDYSFLCKFCHIKRNYKKCAKTIDNDQRSKNLKLQPLAILETDLFHSFMNWAALQKSCFGQKFRQIKPTF